MIRLTRYSAYADRIRDYKIIIDGEFIGKIGDDEILDIDIGPGNHSMYLKIDWCKSETLDFHIEEGELVEFCCGNNTLGRKKWIPFRGVYYITIKRKEYLWLKRSQNEKLQREIIDET